MFHITVLIEEGADVEARDTWNKSRFTTHTCAAFNDTLLHIHTGNTRGRSTQKRATMNCGLPHIHLRHLTTLYHTYTQMTLEAGTDREARNTWIKSRFTTHTFATFNNTLLHIFTGDTRGRSRHRDARQ